MLRGLTYHWRMTLSVLTAAAIATAVLIGAVIVGDSLRASLRILVVDRLGAIDSSLVVQEPFREALADDVRARLDAPDVIVAPVFLLSGSAIQPDSGRLAGDVQLVGIDERFGAFYATAGDTVVAALEPQPGQLFPPVVVNRSLARELGVQVGDPILLNVRQITDIPRESLLGNQPDVRELAGLRGTVSAVVADRGPGRFDLEAHQARPRNAFVALPTLQRRLGYSQRANALLFGGGHSEIVEAEIPRAVEESLTLDDLGLRIDSDEGLLRLSNRRFVLRDSTVEAAGEAARQSGLPALTMLGSLANQLRHGDRMVPYSVVLGIGTSSDRSLAGLETEDGEPIPPLGDSEVVLGAWTAHELDAEPGDSVEMTYFAVGDDDALEERTTRLEVVAIAAMRGLMVDSTALPPFPGIAEADDMSAWTPPFPMDLDLIRPQDEEFWDRYRASPKAIVDLGTAQRLWSSRFGKATVVRVAAGDLAERRTFVDDFEADLGVESFGFVPRPVKQLGLDASAGATDFAGLFLSFSFFLIAAAVLVVALLFSLSVELRAKEVGLRRALGFPLAKVRRLLLAEGTTLAVAGGLVGTALAVAYAGILIRLISGLWKAEIDLPLLRLSLDPLHLALTLAASVLVVALTIAVSLRRLRRVSIPALLSADLATERRRGGRRAGRVAMTSTALVLGLVAAALLGGGSSSPGLFFGAGALAVVAGLSGFTWWMERPGAGIRRAGWSGWLRMAARNGAFNPRRSLLSVGLVCCATFLLVAVAANRRDLDPSDLGRDSGTGGFTVVAESSIPLRGGLDDAAIDRGLGKEARELIASTTTVALRLRPGEDASCLNLYQPREPRVVGVPTSFVDRGGFGFGAVARPTENPWTLLGEDLGPGIVPAIGDANSVTWILHSGLGKDIEIVDDRGETVRLRLVGLLQKSIFQSELLIAEDAFVEHFPQHGGYSYFLAEAPPDREQELIRDLEGGLEDYGFDATTTAAKLARFLGIEEMYLSTFQLLGGLGLVLGTVGLGVVLLRNVNERRGELAMLRAVGFRRRSIAWIVGLETGFHLVVGLVIGGVAGLLALAPHLIDASLQPPVAALGVTAATVFAVGLVATALGVALALRAPLLPALKAE